MRPSPAGDGTKGGSQAGASTDKAQIFLCAALKRSTLPV
jgi:hypothetical protein